MRKVMCTLVVVMTLALVFACKSQPQFVAEVSIEDSLRAVYLQYQEALVLDGATTYTVVAGDSLNGIARVQYNGDGFDYPLILLASSDIIVDEDKLDIGMELTIPNLQANLDDPDARAAFKAVLLAVADIEDERDRGNTAEGLRAKAETL